MIRTLADEIRRRHRAPIVPPHKGLKSRRVSDFADPKYKLPWPVAWALKVAGAAVVLGLWWW